MVSGAAYMRAAGQTFIFVAVCIINMHAYNTVQRGSGHFEDISIYFQGRNRSNFST